MSDLKPEQNLAWSGNSVVMSQRRVKSSNMVM